MNRKKNVPTLRQKSNITDVWKSTHTKMARFTSMQMLMHTGMGMSTAIRDIATITMTMARDTGTGT